MGCKEATRGTGQQFIEFEVLLGPLTGGLTSEWNQAFYVVKWLRPVIRIGDTMPAAAPPRREGVASLTGRRLEGSQTRISLYAGLHGKFQPSTAQRRQVFGRRRVGYRGGCRRFRIAHR